MLVVLITVNMNLMLCCVYQTDFVQYFKRTIWKLGHSVLLNSLLWYQYNLFHSLKTLILTKAKTWVVELKWFYFLCVFFWHLLSQVILELMFERTLQFQPNLFFCTFSENDLHEISSLFLFPISWTFCIV